MKLLAILSTLLLATGANAATATFDFESAAPATGLTSYIETVDGITLTLNAVRNLTFDIAGSGVAGFGSNSIRGVSSGTLSNVDYYISFSQLVRSVSLQFISTSSVADTYTVNLYPLLDHKGTLSAAAEIISPAGSTDPTTFHIAQTATAPDQYLFRSGVLYTSNTEAGSLFYLDNIIVSTEAPGQSTPDVPEPAAWAMMLAGFGAVGIALRRRSKAAFAAA